MKTYIFILLSIFNMGIWAQSINKTLDYANIECLYEFAYLNDTTARMNNRGELISGEKNMIVRDTMILQIGNKLSKYCKYESFYRDSLYETEKDLDFNKKTGLISRAQFMILKNFPTGSTTLTDLIGIDAFKTVEEMPDFRWEIRQETKELSGYTLQRAECKFRGRNYIAWFAPDIPISDGPWRFSGLPGLVMEVYDTKYQYYYKIVGLRKGENSPILFTNIDYINVELNKFYRTLKRYIEDPVGFISNSYGGKIKVQDTKGNSIEASELVKKMKYEFQEIIK